MIDRRFFGAAALFATASILTSVVPYVDDKVSSKTLGLTASDESVDPHKVASKKFVQFQAKICPSELSPTIKSDGVDKLEDLTEARLELENGEEDTYLFWLDQASGDEIFVQSLAPHQNTKIQTFVGYRFIVRSSIDASTVLLDVTVGVHHVHIPDSLSDCVSTTGLGGVARKKSPPGPLTAESTVRGWTNESPCDLLASWVWPNGTERWMADMLAHEWSPHFEVTFLSHDFVFRLTDGRLVKKFNVSPTKVPSCPKTLPIAESAAVTGTNEDAAVADPNATSSSGVSTCAAHLFVAGSAKGLAL